jgi:hypothetical protein
LTHGGCITPHSTTLGVSGGEGKERYDQGSASKHFFTEIHNWTFLMIGIPNVC